MSNDSLEPTEHPDPFAKEPTEFPADSQEGAATFMEHLEELRGTIIKCVLAFFVSCLIVGVFIFKVSDLLTWPLNKAVSMADLDLGTYQGLISDGPMSIFTVILQICFLGGFALSVPFMLFFIARFIAPGLTDKERSYLIPGGLAGVVLFSIGASFCFFFIIPTAMAFSMELNQSMNLETLWTASKYYGMIVWMTMAVGLSFQFPLILLILITLDILRTELMTQNRRIVIVICCVAAAVITPGGDALTLGMIAIPLYVLFEASIFIGKKIERKRLLREEIEE